MRSKICTENEAPISSTAALWALAFGFSAIALPRVGVPNFTKFPAGVIVWFVDITIDPSACGPTVYVGYGSEGVANAGTAAAKAAAPATPWRRVVTIPFFKEGRYIEAAYLHCRNCTTTGAL